jgi:hypothetical protein
MRLPLPPGWNVFVNGAGRGPWLGGRNRLSVLVTRLAALDVFDLSSQFEGYVDPGTGYNPTRARITQVQSCLSCGDIPPVASQVSCLASVDLSGEPFHRASFQSLSPCPVN